MPVGFLRFFYDRLTENWTFIVILAGGGGFLTDRKIN
jgi:hypothetical protein